MNLSDAEWAALEPLLAGDMERATMKLHAKPPRPKPPKPPKPPQETPHATDAPTPAAE